MALSRMKVLLNKILSILFKCLLKQNYSNKRDTEALTRFNIHCDYIGLMPQQLIFFIMDP